MNEIVTYEESLDEECVSLLRNYTYRFVEKVRNDNIRAPYEKEVDLDGLKLSYRLDSKLTMMVRNKVNIGKCKYIVNVDISHNGIKGNMKIYLNKNREICKTCLLEDYVV